LGPEPTGVYAVCPAAKKMRRSLDYAEHAVVRGMLRR
jgi:hypothetical protein